MFWTPLAIAFHSSIYDGNDWMTFDLFIESLWAIAFFINMNRVDFLRQIVTLEETALRYLKSPFLIPDLFVLICSVLFICIDKPLTAQYFKLFRILHFNDSLYPAYLIVKAKVPVGKKRIM